MAVFHSTKCQRWNYNILLIVVKSNLALFFRYNFINRIPFIRIYLDCFRILIIIRVDVVYRHIYFIVTGV